MWPFRSIAVAMSSLVGSGTAGKHGPRSAIRACALLSAVAVACSASGPDEGAVASHGSALSSIAVEDFSGGVAASDSPGTAGAYRRWYDATYNTFGTPSASTLDGAPAMRIDDGGFANGVYAIFKAAIPADGKYRLSVPARIVEAAGAPNGIRAWQVGAAVGAQAVHRGAGDTMLPGVVASASFTGLTTGDDNALPVQTLETAEFDAHAGDDLLVAFGTDVKSGAWNLGSATWGGSYALVGAISLVSTAPSDGSLVLNDDDGAPRFTQAGPWTVSSGVGQGGGHYRFASAVTAASTATWEGTVAPGYYDVFTSYRAGTNRASAARYTVEADGQTLTVTVNQRRNDNQWVLLGGIDASASGTVRVTLSAADSSPAGTVVIADAVRLVPAAPPVPSAPEMRMAAVTVLDEGMDDPGAIESLIYELARYRYNAVAVHARYRGDATYFPNRADTTYPNVEPRSTRVGSVDVLQEFVTRGHARGLSVFAYVNTHLVTGLTAPNEPSHVVNAHPDWRTYAYNGGSPVVQAADDSTEGMWLEPSLPVVQQYLADVVGDIARNYAIDGVVLDRIRYPQTSFTRTNRDYGYHPDAIARFNLAYGKAGIPDPSDADWIAFRQAQITDTVTVLHDRLEAIDPKLQLLAYPIGRLNDALVFNYQDWSRWLTDGVIDGVLPQIYATDTAAFVTALDAHDAAYGGDRLLGVTLNAFQAGVDLEAQIAAVRARPFAGTSPFRHGTMGDLGYLAPLRRAWAGPAAWPATPWKGAAVQPLSVDGACTTTPGLVRFTVHNPNAWAIPVTWRLPQSGATGEYFAAPGDSSYEETAAKKNVVSQLRWRNELREEQTATGHAKGCL
jgi:uncharacterized lipoprotein YddW (UPF0748 family)